MTGKPSLKCLMAFLLLLINCTYLSAQDRVVTGKIKDPQGNPLPGVNVNVWGTRMSVTADVTGSFHIPVSSENSVLVFTFVGFMQKEVKVGTDSAFNVTMAYDNADLDQVVVVGYGTSKRRDLTGSVYSLKPSMVTGQPTSNALEALQGRVPGLEIGRTSGAAGQGVNIQLRGNRTFAGNDKGIPGANSTPLFIIDGFQGGNIADLNPNDIESVEVLKDASATAIYGWMGANGVIIVTTKRGKDRPRVSYNGFYGINGYTSYPKVRIGDAYTQLRRDAYVNTGTGTDRPAPTDDADLYTGNGERAAFQAGQWVDWQDLIREDGTVQSHTFSIQSGGDKTKVFFSTGYFKEKGMLRGNEMTRYNARLNYDQRISNSFKAGLLTQINYQNRDDRKDPLAYASSSIAPLGKPYNDDGSINLLPLNQPSTFRSPLGDEIPGAYKDNRIGGTLNANGFIEFTPISGLSLKSNLGTVVSFNRNGVYQDSLSYTNFGKANYAYQATRFERFYSWENILTFTRKIMDHSFTLTGITSYTRSDLDVLSASGIRQAIPAQLFYNLAATEVGNNRITTSGYTKTNTMSYAGRLNYSFMGKYLLTASIRADGVSRLAPGNKWDYFPSAAVGWNIHQEEFMKDALFVNNLKVRASYGIAGNASVTAYGTQAIVNPNVSGYGQNFGDAPAPGYWFNTILNTANLGWEKTATTNLGLDFAFLKSRIYGTLDLYKAKTTDVLMKRPLPFSTGIEQVWQNIGETENKGIELALSSVNMNSRDFRWTSTLTYTSANEKITKLLDGKDIIGNETSTLLIGRPITSFYSYKKLGIWQTDEKDAAAKVKWLGNTPYNPGDIKVADIDGNDSITNKDQIYLGSTVPKWFAGLQNTFTYKGIELSVYLYARWGQMFNATYMAKYNPAGTGNTPANFNYWTPDNPTNDFPRPKFNGRIDAYNGYQSLNFIDGSYWKIRTVTLAYTLPVNITRKFYTEKLRVYATGNNVFTKTKSHLLKNYEPEGNGSEDNPLTRQIVFGLQADF
jgi:TonB-linked SusC/RagA family outer membrane protein